MKAQNNAYLASFAYWVLGSLKNAHDKPYTFAQTWKRNTEKKFEVFSYHNRIAFLEAEI